LRVTVFIRVSFTAQKRDPRFKVTRCLHAAMEASADWFLGSSYL
jgi:hypothetical protein